MPNRIVRDGINSSARINALSPGAELFYRRLMLVVDDYGRYHGSVVTLQGSCWPTNPGRVKEKDVSKWLTELLKGDEPLVRTYIISGATYLEIQEFGQQTRSKSKFPAPPWFDVASKVLATGEQPDIEIPENVSTSRSRISKSKSSYAADAADVLPFPAPPTEEELIAETAKRLCARHPKKRTCGEAEARKKLTAIVSKLPKGERAAKLADIDRRHQGWCESEDWTKSTGEYAKGLANWLAPTEGRFDMEPPARASPQERKLNLYNHDYVLEAERREREEAEGKNA